MLPVPFVFLLLLTELWSQWLDTAALKSWNKLSWDRVLKMAPVADTIDDPPPPPGRNSPTPTTKGGHRWDVGGNPPPQHRQRQHQLVALN